MGGDLPTLFPVLLEVSNSVAPISVNDKHVSFTVYCSVCMLTLTLLIGYRFMRFSYAEGKIRLCEAPQQTLCCRCTSDTYTTRKILHPNILEILMFM